MLAKTREFFYFLICFLKHYIGIVGLDFKKSDGRKTGDFNWISKKSFIHNFKSTTNTEIICHWKKIIAFKD